jgi:hypothetical protein
MGLDSDMDAWKGDKHIGIREWRSHRELHYYMSNLWHKTAPKEELEANDYEGFNGPILHLSTEDLLKLEEVFLVGDFDLDYDGWDEEDKKEFIEADLLAIGKAIMLSQSGWEITFCSSF